MGSRADRWLRDRFPTLTRRQAEQALEAGLARYPGGRKAHKGDKVDLLDTQGLEEHLSRLRAGTPNLKVAVVHEGKDWVAVDKPAGLDGHPLSLFDDKTLTHWAFARWPNLAQAFPGIQPTVVPHRLDRDTSGIQIIALTADAYSQWRARFQSGQMTKRYLAWVWGEPERESWTARWSIAHDSQDASRMVVPGSAVRHRPPILEAHTEFRVKTKRAGMALLEATCRTGVTHQVRVHAAESGLPLVGDRLYDSDLERRPLPKPGHWLRAVELAWADERLTVSSSEFELGPSQ